jgi:MFS family permease
MKNTRLKVAAALALGSALEYYDFIIFALMAKYIGDLFFAGGGKICSIMQGFSIFAVGYMVRPIGGTIIGMLADIYGRKKPFIAVMLIMGVATLIIGLLPTYAQIGMAAPILLLLCRLLQGISFGAELPGAATIISELAPNNKLGKFYSAILSSTAIGSLLATSMLTLLTYLFNYQQIIDWAWRIPFIIGGFLAILAYFLRRTIVETPEFLAAYSDQSKTRVISPLKLIWNNNISKVLIASGLTLFLASLIIINLYFPIYINKYFDRSLPEIYNAMTVSMASSVIFMVVCGRLSDYFSKSKLLLFFLIIYAGALIPLFKLLDYNSFYAMQIFLIIHQLAIAIFFTNYLPIISLLFPVNIRYTALAFSYNIAFSIAATLPIIISYFLNIYQDPRLLILFIWIAILIALICLLYLRLSYHRDKPDWQ